MSDSCRPRKLEAGLHGMYLMSSDLITSVMKSEPGTRLSCAAAVEAGVPTSAAATRASGRRAEGGCACANASGAPAAPAAIGAVVAAAPATAAPDRNLRRLTLDESRRAMKNLPVHARRARGSPAASAIVRSCGADPESGRQASTPDGAATPGFGPYGGRNRERPRSRL